MSKWLFILPAVYMAAVLNNVVSPYLQVRGVSPDFLVFVAALAGVCASGTTGVAAAGLAGALADIAAPGRLGVSMCVWVLAGIALSAARSFTDRRPLAQTVAAGAAMSFMLFIVSLARGVLGEQSWSLSALAALSAAVGLYGAVLALPCCWLFQRVRRLRTVAY